MIRPGVLVLLLFPLRMQAQDAPRPTLVSKVDPELSKLATEAGVAGTVLLKVTVGVDGVPKDPKILRRIGFGQDEKAVAAVMQWRFRPATVRGVAIEAPATVEMNLRALDNQRRWFRPKTFLVPEGVTPPALTEIDVPPAMAFGTAELEFDVSEEGGTENYRISGTLPDLDQKALLEALRNWKFRPALRDGVPVRCRVGTTYGVK